MAYASFRCLVDAPFKKAWDALLNSLQSQSIRRKGASVADLKSSPTHIVRLANEEFSESVVLDSQKGELLLQLQQGQKLQGQRKYTVRVDRATSKLMIECSLNWSSADHELDRNLLSNLEQLVRQPLIEAKSLSEAS